MQKKSFFLKFEQRLAVGVQNLLEDFLQRNSVRFCFRNFLFERGNPPVKGAYLRNYALEFVHLFTPELDREEVQAALKKHLANGEA